MTTSIQNTAEIERLAKEYSLHLQVAGFTARTAEQCLDSAATPLDFRRRVVSIMQCTLPDNAPREIRADVAGFPDASIPKIEKEVLDAVYSSAHASPVLREVVTKDATGREISSFFGQKRSWMSQYTAAPQVMTQLGNAKF